MFTVTTRSGRALKLAFMHSSADPSVVRPKAGAARQELDGTALLAGRRVTLCEVVELTPDSTEVGGNAYALLGQGISICHPTDTFSKATGRKLSLTYALEAASSDDPSQDSPANIVPLSRDDRADVWAAYLSV